jgi:integrase
MGIFRRHGKYYINYYHRGRRKREMVGTSKGAAIQALSIRLAEIAQGKFKIVPKRGAMTFDGLADKYRELISLHKRGHHVEKYILKTLVAFFGKLRVFDLSAEDGEHFKAVRSKSVKPATVNRELTVAKHMFSKAVEWQIIPDNPFQTVRPLSVPKCTERVLGYDEETKLLDGCDRVRSRFLRPLVLLALHTGMRRGELLSLEWSRVDIDRRTIRIINAKSTAGNRIIPMNATVHALLSDLMKNATASRERSCWT